MPKFYVDAWDKDNFFLIEKPMTVPSVKALRRIIIQNMDFYEGKVVRIMHKLKNGRMKDVGSITYHKTAKMYVWSSPGKNNEIVLRSGELKPIGGFTNKKRKVTTNVPMTFGLMEQTKTVKRK